MEKSFSFWDIFDDLVVQAFAFSLWGVPLYVLIRWLQDLINEHYATELLAIKDTDQFMIGGFIEWFGVPYGLILALVLVNVWTQFDATERAFDRESDSVLALFNTFLFISDKSIKFAVVQKLIMYVNSVVTNPKPVKTDEDGLKNQQEILLKEIGIKIAKLLQTSENPHIPLKLLDLLNNLIDNRGNRLSYSKQRLPPPVKYLSVVTSVVWLIPFFAIRFDNPLIGPFLIVAVTLVVVSILLIIEDLDNPIGGAWEIEFTPWKKIEKIMETELKRLEEDTAKKTE